jgi:hypothetical protein
MSSILAVLALAACDGGPNGDGGDGGALEVLNDEAFDGTCVATPRCPAGEATTACTCVPAPQLETTRTGCAELLAGGGLARNPEDDYCDAEHTMAEADLACFLSSGYRVAGTPQRVTLYGVVDVFGNGSDADAILVEVYVEGQDGGLGDLVGTATASIEDPCAETEDEIDHDMVVGTRHLGFYSIANVPTETPLIIKTSGNTGFWKDLYTYNLLVENGDVETDAPAGDACASVPSGPRHRYKARTLSRGDYNSIPLTAGVPSGITSGNGALAGEVHDCGNVRLEFAQIGTAPRPVTLAYFSDNPDNPLPINGRTEGTSLLGLYAALDLPPGIADVAATGLVGDDIVSLGWYRAQVYPNSVTVVTLRGLRAHQVD